MEVTQSVDGLGQSGKKDEVEDVDTKPRRGKKVEVADQVRAPSGGTW